MTGSAAERRERDDQLRNLYESVEGGRYFSITARLGAFVQTWHWQQCLAFIAFMLSIGSAIQVLENSSDLFVTAWAYGVLFCCALGGFLSLVTILAQFTPGLETWNLLQVIGYDQSRRYNTLARGMLFMFNSLLVLQVNILCDCNSSTQCPDGLEGSQSFLLTTWVFHLLLTALQLWRDFKIPFISWPLINVPWPRLFIVTGNWPARSQAY